MEKFVYFFGDGKADGHGTMKEVLGGKGAGLAEMTNAGLPVPPGFTIATSACRAYFETGNRLPRSVLSQSKKHLSVWRNCSKQQLGDSQNPLACLRSLRRQVFNARHDGYHPEPWHERQAGGGRGAKDGKSSVCL